MTVRLGSLFSGVDGLALGIEAVTDAETAWVCEWDVNASIVLAERFPSAPNFRDITAVRWEDVEPVDILCGGFPCQPFSTAGRRKGTADDRWMWPEFARAIRLLRPRHVFVENVSALLADAGAFGAVLGDLAEVGYHARWTCVRASDVGAPHRRERLFLLATDTRSQRLDGRASFQRDGWNQAKRIQTGGNTGNGPSPRSSATDAKRSGRQGSAIGHLDPTQPTPCGPTAADAQGSGRTRRRREPAGRPVIGRSGESFWQQYQPAIERWETIHGGPAPDPVDDRGRLSPVFVEWMM